MGRCHDGINGLHDGLIIWHHRFGPSTGGTLLPVVKRIKGHYHDISLVIVVKYVYGWNTWSSQTRYLHCRLLRVKNSTAQLFPIFCICVTTCLGTRTLFFAGYTAILEYRVMNGLMFWPRLPWIRQNSFIIYHILISSITSRSTLMTFCKVNGTSMSPANCSRYNQSLSDLLHQWNAEEMTLSYSGPELAMPISQTAIYWEENCDLCAAILVSL